MPAFTFNKIIKILIFSDFTIYSAWGLLSPIFAVFLLENIKGGDASVAGLAAGIYWVTKSVLQVPIGKLMDKIKGEKDDYYAVVAGTFLASFVPLGYLIASEPWHIYALQVFYAFAMAMVIPPWGGLFTRHIDKGREAETWGFESSLLGLGVGAAGIAGGFIAETLGFALIFIAVSAFGFLGAALLLLVRKDVAPPKAVKYIAGQKLAHHRRHAAHMR